MSISAYSSYRDSGLAWAPSLPSHWSSARLRWLARRYAGGTPDKNRQDFWENGTIPWLNSGAVNQSLVRDPSAFITEEALANSSARWVPAGALLMALAGQGKTKGMVAQLGFTATCNQSMAAIVPGTELVERYLLWWLSANYQNVRNMSGGDNRDGLNLELLGDISCPLPSIDEQSAIAIFLDRETAKVDALVEDQRRLIDLLKEKRQAVISRAVTKGLDPTVPMKDSGVEWLGEVPAHWKVAPLKRFGEFNAGAGFPHEEQGFENEELPFYKVNALGSADPDGFLVSSGDSVSRETAARLRAHIFPLNSIVFAKIGAALLLGRIRQLRSEACLDNNLMGYTVHKPNDPAFLALACSLVKFDLIANPGTVPSLNEGQVANVLVSVPPPDEQRAIAAEVKRLTREIDGLADQAAQAITLLQERRSALISSAVTGKIDVRKAAAVEAEAA